MTFREWIDSEESEQAQKRASKASEGITWEDIMWEEFISYNQKKAK